MGEATRVDYRLGELNIEYLRRKCESKGRDERRAVGVRAVIGGRAMVMPLLLLVLRSIRSALRAVVVVTRGRGPMRGCGAQGLVMYLPVTQHTKHRLHGRAGGHAEQNERNGATELHDPSHYSRRGALNTGSTTAPGPPPTTYLPQVQRELRVTA